VREISKKPSSTNSRLVLERVAQEMRRIRAQRAVLVQARAPRGLLLGSAKQTPLELARLLTPQA
jgi:hypothetical protein